MSPLIAGIFYQMSADDAGDVVQPDRGLVLDTELGAKPGGIGTWCEVARPFSLLIA